MSLTCVNCHSCCLGFALNMHHSVSVLWYFFTCWRSSCFEQEKPWRQRSVCVGPALSGCIYSMPMKYLKMIGDFFVSRIHFGPEILRSHDNRGIMIQRCAKTKAFPGLCWRGLLCAWVTSVLKDKVNRTDTFPAGQQQRKQFFFFFSSFKRKSDWREYIIFHSLSCPVQSICN